VKIARKLEKTHTLGASVLDQCHVTVSNQFAARNNIAAGAFSKRCRP